MNKETKRLDKAVAVIDQNFNVVSKELNDLIKRVGKLERKQKRRRNKKRKIGK